MPRYGSGLSPPMSSRRMVTRRLPNGVISLSSSPSSSSSAGGLRRAKESCSIRSRPIPPAPVRPVVEGEFQIITNADVRLDVDALPVQRARRLLTGRLAAHECRPPGGDALLKGRPRGLLRSDHERAPEAVHQEFRPAGDA